MVLRLEMWLIKVISILFLQAKFCQSISSQCCPKDIEWKSGSNCSDYSQVALHCPNGMYKLNPTIEGVFDNFTLIEEELEIFGHDERLQSHRFCLSTEQGAPIALVCFPDDAMSSNPWRTILFGTLCILSALFLSATLFVYAILPELRDLQGRILMSAMTSLLGAYIMLGSIQLLLTPDYSNATCAGLAYPLYYCLMAAFFWLNLVAFNVWRSAWFNRTRISEDTLYWILAAIGWGTPVIFLIIVILGHNEIGNILNPGFGIFSCWFSDPHPTWVYLYGPVACLMTLNIIYFGLTSYELWHKYRSFSGTKLRVLRFKCLLYLKLLLVMGVTWIFEVISFATGADWIHYWLITDVLNGLQGCIIFLLLIATRKRVRKLLAKKRPLGINFPKSWAAGDDEESEIIIQDEEVELSQAG